MAFSQSSDVGLSQLSNLRVEQMGKAKRKGKGKAGPYGPRERGDEGTGVEERPVTLSHKNTLEQAVGVIAKVAGVGKKRKHAWEAEVEPKVPGHKTEAPAQSAGKKSKKARDGKGGVAAGKSGPKMVVSSQEVGGLQRGNSAGQAVGGGGLVSSAASRPQPRPVQKPAAVVGAGGRALYPAVPGGGPKLSKLQMQMKRKLEGAQFRMINEHLYTSHSAEALDKFQAEPHLFDVYHRGFREQVEKWPVHPLDVIIQWLAKYPKGRVADFGCGEARLAASVPNKVHSFDLVRPAGNERVTACDMANVPLRESSVHIAVFCLSLMGTNLADFVREAHRVLVPGGLMKVAEVRSRFEGMEGGVEAFLDVVRRLGFDNRQVDRGNKMFLMMEFKKAKRPPEAAVEFTAKACLYKRR